MKTIRTITFSFLAAAALATAGMAADSQAADIAGAWKLAIGANTVCTLTLAPDGSAVFAGDCTGGGDVARWHMAANKLELRTAAGETVGVLSDKDGVYTGKRFQDGRTLVLSR
jgi:hypothetical protein